MAQMTRKEARNPDRNFTWVPEKALKKKKKKALNSGVFLPQKKKVKEGKFFVWDPEKKVPQGPNAGLKVSTLGGGEGPRKTKRGKKLGYQSKKKPQTRKKKRPPPRSFLGYIAPATQDKQSPPRKQGKRGKNRMWGFPLRFFLGGDTVGAPGQKKKLGTP